MRRRPDGKIGTPGTGSRRSPVMRGVLLATCAVLAVLAVSCSSASRTYQYQHPQPGPGVVYVAEQVNGLEDWARGAESRSFARVYSRSGEAEEGQLMRITADHVVLRDGARPSTSSREIEIEKRNVLFMRVWW
ncbi:MAG: hypothetical protein PVF43_15630 [Candidatus Eiseniibacteriota bacterium]